MIGRDENGRFAPGNEGGPGRPRRDRERTYLTALADVVPLDRWRLICERAATDAEAGDARARNWLGDFLLPPTKDDECEVMTAGEAMGFVTAVTHSVMRNVKDADAIRAIAADLRKLLDSLRAGVR